MRKSGKIVAAAVCASLALPFVSGCKGKAEDGKVESKPVEITMWYGGTVSEAGEPPSDWVAYDIIREKLGIDLKLTMLPSSETDRDAKLNATAAAKTLPDVFTVNREPWLRMIEGGMLSTVDDMYEKMPNRTKIMYDETARNFTTVNGHSYGLASPGSIARNEGLLIRKDWLDRLGLQVPKTTEEFLEVMKAFTEKDPDGNGQNDTYGFGAFLEIYQHQEGFGRRLEPIMGAFGVEGTWSMKKETAGLNVLRPEYYDAVEFVKRMVDEKAIDPNWLVYKKDDFRAAWKQGKFGIMREQNAAFASESNYKPFDKNFPNGEWIVIDPPVGPSGKSSTGCFIQGYRITAISKNAESKKDAIARLFEWMSSDEGYYLLGWGVEGVNYTKNSDGVPVADNLPDPSKAFSKPEMQPLTQLRAYVFYNSNVELYSRYPTYETEFSHKKMSALDVLNQMDKLPYTPAVGSDSMPAPDADLKRFYEQGIIEFVTGKRELTHENWDAFIAQFKQLGGENWNQAGIAYATENNLLY
ncbi:MAG: extracellular solute-binding protein [Treponema sp.]|nr:extracellular solute-binding protein [Treponema sp.]